MLRIANGRTKLHNGDAYRISACIALHKYYDCKQARKL